MRKNNTFKNKLLGGKRPYLISLAVCFLSMLLDQTNPQTSNIFVIAGLSLTAIILAALIVSNKLTYEHAILLIFLAGIVLRISYTLYTPYHVRQHDVGIVGMGNSHAGYIEHIANTFSLPQTNAPWQFYHPPLHHIIAGVFMRAQMLFGLSIETAMENIQLLTTFYSISTMFVSYSILKELNLKRTALVLSTALISLHPTFYLIGGNVNNDMLMILLSFCTILFLVKWYKDPNVKNILGVAFSLGLSMMAKLSGALLTPCIALIFVVKLFEHKAKFKTRIKQYILFCVISIPLGLWYPVRNLILFNQPLNYVPNLDPSSGQYIAHYSIAQRLWQIPFSQLSTPYQVWDNNFGYNIPLSLFKTALFGEKDLGSYPYAYIALFASVVLALVAFISMVYYLAVNKEQRKSKLNWAMGIIWLTLMMSYISFCFGYPNICSQDFRYIVPTLIVSSYFLGKLVIDLKSKVIRITLYTTSAIFLLSSAVVYTNLIIYSM